MQQKNLCSYDDYGVTARILAVTLAFRNQTKLYWFRNQLFLCKHYYFKYFLLSCPLLINGKLHQWDEFPNKSPIICAVTSNGGTNTPVQGTVSPILHCIKRSKCRQ